MADTQKDLKKYVEDLGGVQTVRGGGADDRAWNGIRYKTGLSGKNVGSQGLSMNVATVPPGAVAYAHIHEGFEVMLFILQGRVRHDFGPDLKHSVENEAGVPHEVFNIGDGPLVAVVARSAADEWDKIVDYPSEHRPSDAESQSKEATS